MTEISAPIPVSEAGHQESQSEIDSISKLRSEYIESSRTWKDRLRESPFAQKVGEMTQKVKGYLTPMRGASMARLGMQLGMSTLSMIGGLHAQSEREEMANQKFHEAMAAASAGGGIYETYSVPDSGDGDGEPPENPFMPPTPDDSDEYDPLYDLQPGEPEGAQPEVAEDNYQEKLSMELKPTIDLAGTDNEMGHRQPDGEVHVSLESFREWFEQRTQQAEGDSDVPLHDRLYAQLTGEVNNFDKLGELDFDKDQGMGFSDEDIKNVTDMHGLSQGGSLHEGDDGITCGLAIVQGHEIGDAVAELLTQVYQDAGEDLNDPETKAEFEKEWGELVHGQLGIISLEEDLEGHDIGDTFRASLTHLEGDDPTNTHETDHSTTFKTLKTGEGQDINNKGSMNDCLVEFLMDDDGNIKVLAHDLSATDDPFHEDTQESGEDGKISVDAHRFHPRGESGKEVIEGKTVDYDQDEDDKEGKVDDEDDGRGHGSNREQNKGKDKQNKDYYPEEVASGENENPDEEPHYEGGDDETSGPGNH